MTPIELITKSSDGKISFVMTLNPILYLLSGNGSNAAWWDDALPHFAHVQPIPIELPGSGSNPSDQHKNLDQLARALLAQTQSGQTIFVVGVNALVVLRALVLQPGHFSRVFLLAPVGAFLWQRGFVKFMALPPLRKLSLFLLRRLPKLFARRFSTQTWTDAQYQRMAEGYRQSRAFEDYFRCVQPHNSLDLTDWIEETPIELIWGTRDAVLDVKQAAAWDSILPRADLTVTIQKNWGHYPYIDDPKSFVQFIEARVFIGRGAALLRPYEFGHEPNFKAHTKAGRLKLAELAGLPVPPALAFSNATFNQVDSFVSSIASASKPRRPSSLFAVRSSSFNEDKIDASNAGRYHTFLRVPPSEIKARVRELLDYGLDEVVVQPFIEPKASGVAFVRHIGAEIEWVEGHLEHLVNGTKMPQRLVLSRLGGEWEMMMGGVGDKVTRRDSPPHPVTLSPAPFPLYQLNTFLQRCIAAFHYAHSDIEWAWDGEQFWLLQLRPVTKYAWHRCLNSANMDEILPKQVSRVMEYAQRRSAETISRAYALWDTRVLNDNEPFSALFEDASYINFDLFLSRFFDWGLPSSLFSGEIGGAVPKIAFNPIQFLRSAPMQLTMLRKSRAELLKIEAQLREFELEFEGIRNTKKRRTEVEEEENSSVLRFFVLNEKSKEDALVNWFVRFYTFIVQTNLFITAALTSSGGSGLSKAHTVYAEVNPSDFPHRVPFESDPATPRRASEEKPLLPFPAWNTFTHAWHGLGLPGLGGRYFEVREWFRDSHARLLHRLHNELRGSEWLTVYPSPRTRSGTFWQDGVLFGDTDIGQHDLSFVIYPGSAEGVVGQDILIVDSLDSGQYERYKLARAVIARTGGRLSHGATLLRELRKPSAVIPDANKDGQLNGSKVRFENGRIVT